MQLNQNVCGDVAMLYSDVPSMFRILWVPSPTKNVQFTCLECVRLAGFNSPDKSRLARGPVPDEFTLSRSPESVTRKTVDKYTVPRFTLHKH